MGHMKKFTVMWIMITLLGLGVNYMPIYPTWIALHGAKVSSRAEIILNVLNIIKSESFHSTATDATVTSFPLSLIWTLCRESALFLREIRSHISTISILPNGFSIHVAPPRWMSGGEFRFNWDNLDPCRSTEARFDGPS